MVLLVLLEFVLVLWLIVIPWNLQLDHCEH